MSASRSLGRDGVELILRVARSRESPDPHPSPFVESSISRLRGPSFTDQPCTGIRETAMRRRVLIRVRAVDGMTVYSRHATNQPTPRQVAVHGRRASNCHDDEHSRCTTSRLSSQSERCGDRLGGTRTVRDWKVYR